MRRYLAMAVAALLSACGGASPGGSIDTVGNSLTANDYDLADILNTLGLGLRAGSEQIAQKLYGTAPSYHELSVDEQAVEIADDGSVRVLAVYSNYRLDSGSPPITGRLRWHTVVRESQSDGRIVVLHTNSDLTAGTAAAGNLVYNHEDAQIMLDDGVSIVDTQIVSVVRGRTWTVDIQLLKTSGGMDCFTGISSTQLVATVEGVAYQYSISCDEIRVSDGTLDSRTITGTGLDAFGRELAAGLEWLDGLELGELTPNDPVDGDPTDSDTTAPTITYGTSPPAVTIARSASFTFAADETSVTYYCQLDQGMVFDPNLAQPCGSALNLTNLSVGPHLLTVAGYDAAGNRSNVLHHSWRAGLLAHGGSTTLSPTLVDDLNNDGLYEIIASDLTSSVVVMPITDSVLSWSMAVTGDAVRHPVVADFNADGTLDVATAYYSGDFSSPAVALHGTTGVALWHQSTHSYGGWAAPLVAAFWDYDVSIDLIVDSDWGVELLGGADGSVLGTYAGAVNLAAVAETEPSSHRRLLGDDGATILRMADAPTLSTVASRSLPDTVGGSMRVEFVDYDSDGVLEVLATANRTVHLLSSSDLSTIWSRTAGYDWPGYISATDLDNDGYLDVVQNWNSSLDAVTSGTVAALSGLDGSVMWQVATDGHVHNTLLLDVNADTTPDVVYVETSDSTGVQTLVARDGSDGSLLDSLELPDSPIINFLNLDFQSVHGPVGAYPSAGDWNYDGYTDIALNTGKRAPDGVWIVATDWPAPPSYAWPTLRRTSRRNGSTP